ncbi:MAG: hypothetical protein EA357_11320 [Micavibrio sp.]|nr:MAG: hypothetical protein EA357_11320 [Micavibrio sp.]
MLDADFLKNIDMQKPFALIEKDGRLNFYQGRLHRLEAIGDIHDVARRENTDLVFVLPYRAIRERGFDARGDEPVLGLSVQMQAGFATEDILPLLPQDGIALDGGVAPETDDAVYAALVADFQKNEIEGGHVSQTTISRRFKGKIKDLSPAALLGTFRKIILRRGHYMAVLFNNPEDGQVIIAATPERHLEVTGTRTIMTPIAGTLRKEDRDSFPARLKNFIRDEKEINELFQVLDEEMKIMGLICPEGGAVDGPFLREVGAVVHSEYNLLGKRTLHSIDALRETLHAPTVVGSPMESAARMIAKYEPESRRYYAGEIGIYRRPRTDAPDGDIDSAILIRMAEIFADGTFTVQSGGGIVRDSDPENEARESTAKAQGILRYFGEDGDARPYLTEELLDGVRAEFTARNAQLSQFWLDKQDPYDALKTGTDLQDLSVTIINNEDNFAYMIAHVIRSFGAEVAVIDTFAYEAEKDNAAVTVIGPGPGNPNDATHPRMAQLHRIAAELRGKNRPVLGICLGHQILARHEGLNVAQQTSSTQGMPLQVTVAGKNCRLGFYNSFSPVMDGAAEQRGDLRFDCDDKGRIIALFGNGFTGYQFHPESVMSQQGVALLYDALKDLCRAKIKIAAAAS